MRSYLNIMHEQAQQNNYDPDVILISQCKSQTCKTSCRQYFNQFTQLFLVYMSRVIILKETCKHILNLERKRILINIVCFSVFRLRYTKYCSVLGLRISQIFRYDVCIDTKLLIFAVSYDRFFPRSAYQSNLLI